MAVQPPIKPSTAQYHVTARGGSQPVTNTASQAANVAKGQATAPRLTPQRTNKSHSKAASDTQLLVDQESSFDIESKACNSHGNGEDVAVLRSVPVMQEGQMATKNGRGQQMSTLSPLYDAWTRGSDVYCATGTPHGPAGSTTATVVDYGAAYGINALRAAAEFPHLNVVAADVDAQHLEYIDAKARTMGLSGVTTKLADYLPAATPFRDGSVDSILVGEVLHFCTGDEVLAAFREFYRVLAPGGTVCVTAHTGLTNAMKTFFNLSDTLQAQLNTARRQVADVLRLDAKTLGESRAASRSPISDITPEFDLVFPGELDKEHMYGAMERMCREEGYDLPKSAWPKFFHVLPVELLAGAAVQAGFTIQSAVNGHHPGVVSRLQERESDDEGDAQLVAVKPFN